MPTADAIGKLLREACADRSGPTAGSVATISAILAEPNCDVNNTNRNGKAPIHFAAQLRCDTEVLALLVNAKADVNASTHRGHTPLIYAAGRKRPATIEFLLSHGADAATWTVGGECAVRMGRRKGLPDEILERLEASQRSSTNPRDFRGDERAIRAQQEHARSCPCCRRKLAEDYGVAPPEELAAVELAIQLGAAAAESTDALSAALVAAAADDAPALRRALEFSLSGGDGTGDDEQPDEQQPAAEPETWRRCGGATVEEVEGLGMGIEALIVEEEPVIFEEEEIGTAATCEQLLRASRDEALGKALGKGARGKARRPVRVVAGALFSAIQSPGVVERLAASGTSLAALVDAADGHLAAELVRRWPGASEARDVCLLVWSRQVHNNGWADTWCERTPRKSGGPKVATWARAMRWAGHVGFAGWEECVEEVLGMAESAGPATTSHLLCLIRQCDEGGGRESTRRPERVRLPPALRALLVSRFGEQFGVAVADGKQLRVENGAGGVRRMTTRVLEDVDPSSLPLAELPEGMGPIWLDTSDAVASLHATLRDECAARVAAGQPLLRLGVDTEWCHSSEADERAAVEGASSIDGNVASVAQDAEVATAPPASSKRRPPRVAIVQLATDHRAWVIDALAAASEVGRLLRWALESEAMQVIGFAFRGDIEVLRPLCGDDMVVCSLMDVQALATAKGEDTPSLRKVCARALGKQLDKSEQCSEWARRPLEREQLVYAALDAQILLPIYQALVDVEVDGDSTKI
jgi:hypothetical protein